MERGSGGCKLPRGPQGHRTGPDGSVELVAACVFGARAGPEAMHLVTNDGVGSSHAHPQAGRPPNLDQKREVEVSRCQPSWFISKAAFQRLTGANPSHSNVKVASTQISALRLTSPAAMVSTSPRALCACHKIHDRKRAGRCVRWPQCHEAAVRGRDPHLPPAPSRAVPRETRRFIPTLIRPSGPFEVVGVATCAPAMVRCLKAVHDNPEPSSTAVDLLQALVCCRPSEAQHSISDAAPCPLVVGGSSNGKQRVNE